MQWNELFSESAEYRPEAGAPLALPTGGGVYLLVDAQDRLVQLASAADLRRAVLNRLAPAHPSPAPDPGNQAAGGTTATNATSTEPTSTEPNPTEPTSTEPPSENASSDPEAAPGDAALPDVVAPTVSRRRADLSQIVRRVWWEPTHSVFEAACVYHRIARVVLPDTYLKNIAFGPAWFVHVDPDAAIPRFCVGKTVTAAEGTTLGPFSTQQDANRFVQILEDAFDLCRYLHILEQVPHGEPCAYFEMGRCPAPCNASIPMSDYRTMMGAALRFALGQRDEARAGWEQQMRDAATRLEFERASAVKQRIERARQIEHAAFRLVRPIERFSWLVLQRGGGRTRIKPFFVRAGWIQAGEVVRLKDLDGVVPQWLQRMRERPEPGTDTQLRSEQIWLLSHFLFRRERVGLFFDASALPDVGELSEAIRQGFAPAPGDADASSPRAEDPG